MAFAKRHPIRMQIDGQKIYIENMVKFYPEMCSLLEQKVIKDIEKYEVELKNEDLEVKETVRNQMYEGIEMIANTGLDSTFYRSMLLLAYSYFESSIRNIAIGSSIKANSSNPFDNLKKILTKRHIKLEDNTRFIQNRLENIVHLFRNDLTHNNGNPRNEDTIKELKKEYQGEIDYENKFIDIHGPSLILDSLEMEYTLLAELCDQLGFRTELV